MRPTKGGPGVESRSPRVLAVGDPIVGSSRWRRPSRWAGWGLVAVLVGVAGFDLWASQYTSQVTQRAVVASRVSEEFDRASDALATEESLERKYRLEPSPGVRGSFDRAAADLVSALEAVRSDSGRDASDAAVVMQLLPKHAAYLEAIGRTFAAVDRGDTSTVLAIDSGETDPMFGSIEEAVNFEADEHHDDATRALDKLSRLESFTGKATPAVFAMGLLLAALFAATLRRVRRQLHNQRERALHDSLHDQLTGLPNRALLADRFDQALRAGRRQNLCVGFLLIDLDRFKEVNDTLGHRFGDRLLTQIGPRLATVLRDMDTVARLGGDEFAVVLPTVDSVSGVMAVAARLRDALSAPFDVEGIEVAVEASIGVAVSGVHGDDMATLLQRADIAMYIAKEQGIGVLAYDPGLDDHSPERLGLLGEMRRALDQDELVLHYQPQIVVRTGEICGAEALVRWQHPTRGLVPPDEFIPLAEHTALIGPLTLRVLDLALAQIRAWLDAGYRVPVAVNISARNLLDESLEREILERLEHHRVPANLLEVEITESAIMTEPERAKDMLTRLHESGIRIAIDDFGAGYTSLARLKDLPVSELKVDKSFVISMDTDASNALIVQSVVELSHNLGLTAVAEGVESEGALTVLARYGCDTAQGYHISHPLAPEAFLVWHATHRPIIDADTGPTTTI